MASKQKSEFDIPDAILDAMALEYSKDEASKGRLHLAYNEASPRIRSVIAAARHRVHGLGIPELPESKKKKDHQKRLKSFVKRARAYMEELRLAREDQIMALSIEVMFYTADPKKAGVPWKHIKDLEILLKAYDDRPGPLSFKKASKGRPSKLKRLEDFTYEMALLYQKATGKKFTVDRFVGESGIGFISEGQSFVHKAFLFLIDGYPLYTSENFQSACVYVSKRLKEKSLTKNKVVDDFL